MRPLNDFHMDFGNLAVKGAGIKSNTLIVPEDCDLVACQFNCVEEITVAAADCDIFVNTADTAGVDAAAVDITFPITAVNVGGEVQPGAQVHLTRGDAINLESNGSPTLGIINITAAFRR